MKDMVKRHPVPIMFTTTTLLLVGAESYVGYQNLDYLYKKLGLVGTKGTISFMLTSYELIICSIIAVLLSFKLAEWFWNRKLVSPKLMEFSWRWVLVILPSPLYVLAMLSFEEVCSVVVNRLFIASWVVVFVSFGYSYRKQVKKTKRKSNGGN